MKFEWNFNKAIDNEKKHGISFLEAGLVFSDLSLLSKLDEKHSDKEERWISLGKSPMGNIIVVVHSYRESEQEEVTRLISARKATKKEEKQYFERMLNKK